MPTTNKNQIGKNGLPRRVQRSRRRDDGADAFSHVHRGYYSSEVSPEKIEEFCALYRNAEEQGHDRIQIAVRRDYHSSEARRRADFIAGICYRNRGIQPGDCLEQWGEFCWDNGVRNPQDPRCNLQGVRIDHNIANMRYRFRPAERHPTTRDAWADTRNRYVGVDFAAGIGQSSVQAERSERQFRTITGRTHLDIRQDD